MVTHVRMRLAALAGVAALGISACGGSAAQPMRPSATQVTRAAVPSVVTAPSPSGTGARTAAPTEPTAGAVSTAPPDAPPSRPTRGELDRAKPVAVVNGEAITWDELDRDLELRYGEEATQGLIVVTLVEQEAERRKVVATPAEVVAELRRAREQIQAGDFEGAVRQQFGTVAAFREQLRVNILLRKMLQDRVQITEPQLQAFYAENRQQFAAPQVVRLVRVATDTEQQAVAAARELRRGGRAEAVARKHGSKEGERASQSGDLGFLPVLQLPPELAAAAAGLEPKGVSEPIVLPGGGFAVLRLEARRGGTAPPLASIKERVRLELRDRQIGQLSGEFVQQLREKAKVTNQFEQPRG